VGVEKVVMKKKRNAGPPLGEAIASTCSASENARYAKFSSLSLGLDTPFAPMLCFISDKAAIAGKENHAA
jgi:hypothetical protein